MTTFSGAVSSITAGTTTLAAPVNNHRDALKGLSEALTSYAPTYAGITSIGNATVSAYYQQVDKWIRGHVKIVMGGTTTFAAAGTTITVSLPVAAHGNWAANVPVGTAFLLDAGVSGTRTIATAITATASTVFFVAQTVGGTVTTSSPWTWASTDTLSFNFEYEAA